MPYFGIPIRNGLPIGLGSVAGFGIAPFSPESLFENGEVGAWYDPSDYSTLFQDSAGTTPVSAPGNGSDVFVGLMLDKSKGLVLGPQTELVTNGTFASNITGWTNGIPGQGSIAWNSASGAGALELTMSASPSYPVGTAPVNLTAGVWYTFTVNVLGALSTATTAAIAVYSTGTPSNSVTDALRRATVIHGGQTVSVTLQYSPPTTGTYYIGLAAGGSPSAGQVVLFDNASVKQWIQGNHAFQTNSLKRPKLAARYNLLTYTEEFDNASVWATASRVTITANTTATLDPLGGTTADIMTEVALTGTHRVEQANVPNSLTTIANTFSCYFKLPSGATRNACLFLTDAGGSNQCRGFFNLTTLAVSSSAVGSSVVSGVSITPVGNGWFKCSLTGVVNSSGTAYAYVAMSDGANISYLGDTGESIYIWGADLRPASQATGLIGPTYQRVAAANVYDTAGFLPYLAFDGLDDSMSTNSIDFSAGDKMTVWAGIRKLSDAARGMLLELSAVATNPGTFYLAAPDTNGVANFGIYLSGPAFYQPTTFAAPTTQVISTAFDRNAVALSDKVVPRFNGVLNQTNAGTNVASGNFSNNPLYIGARDNTSLFFNGWLTSLIIRGAQSTQSQIEATEAWVNGKTGAY